MRDSWIDKDEFEELVQAFSPSKGRKRGARNRPAKNRAPKKSEEVEERPPVAEEPPPAPREEELIADNDPLAISSIDLIDEYANPDVGRGDEAESEITEWDVAQVEIVEEKVVEKEPEPILEEKVEAVPERKIRFLKGDDPVAEEPVSTGGSVADAVKAVKALAEARIKVDKGGLIRQKESQAEPTPGLVEDLQEEAESVEEIEPILNTGEEDAQSIEEEEDGISFVDAIEGEALFASIPLQSSTKNEAILSREGTIRRRLEKFAELLHEKLSASDVVVMDGEGFPLYEEENGSTSTRLEKSGGPYRLAHDLREIAAAAGLEDRISTQVSLGNGQWLCLLYSAETTDEGPLVRAVIPRALEGNQLQKWSNLLGAALHLEENPGDSINPEE